MTTMHANPTDWKHRPHTIFLGPPPFTLGWDVSGVVEQAGFGVTIFKPAITTWSGAWAPTR
jgi:NADPH:quinone reductase-like Zn-dependent oxidoreductase